MIDHKIKPEPPPTADDPAESKRFIDMAGEIDADESPEAMDEAFRKVVKPKAVTPSVLPSHRSEKPASS
jgi:hypothetical protein